ncbi:methylase involved in ubiquinone/menaquinone biosynthesis [Salinarchaeum sp. Harcht-Bsk1]|uniref:class I SAM-dependent methyltransferase n=1 Tax=Salinarchaeum sp. Harcht-Bsk1 TaxID=1333523 RepID=UPI00034249A3|nr:class I SAM-dependent methyltransferase [Salinarchaeum sp. Harcht-Bsk1]AGN02247.1 methylase involved in ubiquinone/menaquinone biosynthesis [Salinarchaeum sp. Harcht-Bsk1]
MTEEARAWWEATADDFQRELDLPVELNWMGLGTHVPRTGEHGPADLDLLPDVDGAEVVELGCGGGQCTVALAKRGADGTGIDVSPSELEHARELATEHDVAESIEFVEGDVRDLSMLEHDSFDVACDAWVFQWVDDLRACFEEARRVLRPDGRFVFSMPHPTYDLVDPETHEVVESYFGEPRQVEDVEGMETPMVTYRHRISDVFADLRAANFAVEQLREPGTDAPEAYEDGPWGEFTADLMAKLPTTLIVDARPA